MNLPPKRTIVLNFDGVLHSCQSGWKGPDVIPDPPVEGMADACRLLLANGYNVVVMSSRARYPEGRDAMGRWLEANGFPLLPLTIEKIPAVLYVDARGYRFNGSANDMLSFIFVTGTEPWNDGAQITGERS